MIKILHWLFKIALVDAFAAWLLVIFYLTGIDLIWGVNFAFIAMTLLLLLTVGAQIRLSWFSGYFLFFLVLGVAKIVLFFDSDIGFEVKHIFTYFFGLLMPFLALSFSLRFFSKDKLIVYTVLQCYAHRYAIIAISAIFIYSIFYFSGTINYFGLGANLHYSYPFLLASHKGTSVISFIFIVLISGKRAVLINYLSQTAAYYFAELRSRPILATAMLTSLGAGLTIVLNYTSLLDRFSWFLNNKIDFSDAYFMYVSFGGRFEELQGIYEYFMNNPYQLIFGSPPGAFYTWEITEGTEYYAATKNYSHISIFGLIFRYGIIFGIGLYVIFAFMLIKYWSPKDPLYLVFLGIVTSSLFGANLIVDPTSWLFLGLMISLRRGDKSVALGASVSVPLRIDRRG